MVQWSRKLWAEIKYAPFVEPRLSALYGILTGVFLSLAIELLIKPFTGVDSTLSYLQITGGLFLAASFMLGLLTFEMQLFHSFLAERKDLDRPAEVKREKLEEWGHLGRVQLYFALFLILMVAGLVVLGLTTN